MAPLDQLVINADTSVAVSADFDELAIYATALPAATIWRHYDATNGKNQPYSAADPTRASRSRHLRPTRHRPMPATPTRPSLPMARSCRRRPGTTPPRGVDGLSCSDQMKWTASPRCNPRAVIAGLEHLHQHQQPRRRDRALRPTASPAPNRNCTSDDRPFISSVSPSADDVGDVITLIGGWRVGPEVRAQCSWRLAETPTSTAYGRHHTATIHSDGSITCEVPPSAATIGLCTRPRHRHPTSTASATTVQLSAQSRRRSSSPGSARLRLRHALAPTSEPPRARTSETNQGQCTGPTPDGGILQKCAVTCRWATAGPTAFPAAAPTLTRRQP